MSPTEVGGSLDLDSPGQPHLRTSQKLNRASQGSSWRESSQAGSPRVLSRGGKANPSGHLWSRKASEKARARWPRKAPSHQPWGWSEYSACRDTGRCPGNHTGRDDSILVWGASLCVWCCLSPASDSLLLHVAFWGDSCLCFPLLQKGGPLHTRCWTSRPLVI